MSSSIQVHFISTEDILIECKEKKRFQTKCIACKYLNSKAKIYHPFTNSDELGVAVRMFIQSVSIVSFTIIMCLYSQSVSSPSLHDQIFNVCIQLLVIQFHLDQPLWRRKYGKSNQSVRVSLRHLIYVYERKVSDFFLFFAKLWPITTDMLNFPGALLNLIL